MIDKLSPHDLSAALRTLPDWQVDEQRNALRTHIKLADFSAAFGLMTRIALAAEKADHHPEWSNVYDTIDIWLTTHDAGGVSAKDIAMAVTIDRLRGS